MSMNVEPRSTRYVVCSVCDIGCQLRAETEDGRLTRILPHDNPILARNVCFKGIAAPQIHNHPDRLRVPLKRVGERGQDHWEEISHEQAIAARVTSPRSATSLAAQSVCGGPSIGTVPRPGRSRLRDGIPRRRVAWIVD